MLWIMTVLWIAMLCSPIALLVAFLPSGRACPRCAAEDTLPIRWAVLRPVRRWLTRRWCTLCGWEGVARRGRSRRRSRRLESVPDARQRADGDAPWRSA